MIENLIKQKKRCKNPRSVARRRAPGSAANGTSTYLHDRGGAAEAGRL